MMRFGGMAFHAGRVGIVLALLGVASASAATAPRSAAFAFAHAGAVDSGLVSLLGFYSATQTSAAAPLAFPMFDPSLGSLSRVGLSVGTSTSTFAITPTGLLSLISFAAADRALNYTVVAGATTATDGGHLLDSGAALLTLLGLGGAEIGGVALAKTTTFSALPDLLGFVGSGQVGVSVVAADTLSVFTVLSLFNGAGFKGSGQYTGVATLTYTYTPYPGGAQLTIDKSASRSVTSPGGVITYTLVFTNGGITPIDTLAVADVTPVYTSYLSARPVAVPAGLAAPVLTAPAVGAKGPVAWSFAGRLAPAATGTLEYSVVVDQ